MLHVSVRGVAFSNNKGSTLNDGVNNIHRFQHQY